MTTSPSPAVDHLLAHTHETITAALNISQATAADDHDCGDDCGICDDLDWLATTAGRTEHAAAEFDKYSDGRTILGSVEYQHGCTFTYVFPPIVEHPAERELTRIPLAQFDAGMPSPGTAVIYVDDQACAIRADLQPGNVVTGRFGRDR